MLADTQGFIRDVVIARFFGTGMYSQAFVVAFRIPNLLRDMVAEGAENAADPVFSEYAAKNQKRNSWHLANCLLNILLVILAALTILGVVFSPWIVRLIAPGFSADTLKISGNSPAYQDHLSLFTADCLERLLYEGVEFSKALQPPGLLCPCL